MLERPTFPQSNLSCGFSVAGSVSPLLKPNWVWTRKGRPYSCCTSLHWFSAPVLAQPPRQQALCDGATFFKTASPTKDKRRSLRKQHTENHFPSIQKAPPEIPVKKWEHVGISKQHRNMSKHTAKNTAAYWIWYTSSRKQVYAHKTMQQYITPGKVWREQCCILTLLRFFSAIASWRQTPPELSPSSPVLCRCHRPRAGWVQAPEGQAGWKQLSSLTRGCGDWLLLSVVDKSPVYEKYESKNSEKTTEVGLFSSYFPVIF